MIDLTNKTPEEINALIQKFAPVLQQVKIAPEHYLQLAYIFDIGTKYLIIQHKDLDDTWKTWCMLVLKEMYIKNKINSELDITNIVEDFINHYNLNYESYCNYMASANEYDQQRGFVHSYILKKGR
ncbi:MAG: hypothetical protein WC428_01670 [Candidatus Paceibacterota bacterium]|jgi:hypothetical protein